MDVTKRRKQQRRGQAEVLDSSVRTILQPSPEPTCSAIQESMGVALYTK